jgi:hypothetical protein
MPAVRVDRIWQVVGGCARPKHFERPYYKQ